MAELQSKDQSQSIFQLVDLTLGGMSETQRRNLKDRGNQVLFQETEKAVIAFGDSQFLNAALFENYLSQFLYYDDDMERTASYADAFSMDECHENYIAVTQDYSMRQFSYLPSAVFRA